MDAKDAARRARADLATQMRDEPQAYLELAADYGSGGLWDEAIDVLSRFEGSLDEFNVE